MLFIDSRSSGTRPTSSEFFGHFSSLTYTKREVHRDSTRSRDKNILNVQNVLCRVATTF